MICQDNHLCAKSRSVILKTADGFSQRAKRGTIMKESRVYQLDRNKKVPFNNHVDFCIGTGRMGLALQKEYFEQLKLVQEEIGFKHIRGHGLFRMIWQFIMNMRMGKGKNR